MRGRGMNDACSLSPSPVLSADALRTPSPPVPGEREARRPRVRPKAGPRINFAASGRGGRTMLVQALWQYRKVVDSMRFLHLAAFVFVLSTAAHAAPNRPPVAPERPVTDDYFGTKVTDPYRWMENRTAPEFIRYMLAQGKVARRVIDHIPARDRLQARVAGLSGGGAVVRLAWKAGRRIFFLKR